MARGRRGSDTPPAWAVEHDDRSLAELKRVDGPSGVVLTLHYTLGAGRPLNQFAALVGVVGDGLSRYDRVMFTARASHPLRVGVQLRPVGHDNPPRWQRSVYLDDASRIVTVRFEDLRPIPRDVTDPPPLASIGALMFVVDTNNTVPGTSGDISFTDISFGPAR